MVHDYLYLFVPAITITILLGLTSKNLYIKLRRKFAIKVNCWFCNDFTRVPYDQFNCFTCPHCDQYNGFKEDGDYNCLIKAQHYKSLNSTSNSVQSEEDTSQLPKSNGLCTLCNRNQELKINQLASYVPEDEANYEYEIEDYEKKLEQCYKLCSRCERTVKRSLINVKRNILGSKMAQHNLNKTRIDDYKQGRQKAKLQQRKQLMLKAAMGTLLFLAIWNLCLTVVMSDVSKSKLEQMFPPIIANMLLKVIAYAIASKTLLFHYLSENCVATLLTIGTENVKLAVLWTGHSLGLYNPFVVLSSSLSTVDAISLGALALNVLLLMVGRTVNREKLIYSILTWMTSMTFASATVTDTYAQIIGPFTLDVLKLFTSTTNTVLAYQCLNTLKKSQTTANLTSSLHKIHSECVSDASDDSDLENDISYPSTTKSTPSMTNAVRRACSMNSFTSAPRLTPALLRNFDESQSNRSFCGSHKSGATKNSYLTAPSNFLSTNFQPDNRTQYSNSRSMFGSPSVAASHLTVHKNGSYMNDEHFRENIDRLSISGAAARNGMQQDRNRNPFYNVQEDSRALTPSEFSYSVRQRRTVSPANSVTSAPASWVAGGYWTNQSPQKHKSDFPQLSPQENALGFYPILSRTSSQSSGFESQVTVQEGPNSRENSVFQDPDRFSVFGSDRTFGQINKPQPHHTFKNPKIPAISLFDYHKSERLNYSNSCNFSSRHSSVGFGSQPSQHAFASTLPTSQQHPNHTSPLYRQFGTQRLYDEGPASPQNFLRKGSIFNLDKINSTLTGS